MEEFSILDAFKALKDVSDDIIYTTPKRTGKIGAKKADKSLNEAITVDLNSTISPEEADKAVEEATAKVDRPITIVDVNADTLEHVKDKVEYVGQVILKCKKCQGLKFIDMDKLITSEIDDPSNEGEKIEVYNVEDECPTCHSEGEGFDIVGQVAKAPDTTSEEATAATNDETPPETETAEQEETTEVENTDNEEDTSAEDTSVEETSTEETETTEGEVDNTLEDETEEDFMNVEEEDDTADMEDESEDVDQDDVEEDDTETNESLEDGKLRGLLNGLNESDGEVIEEEEEIFDYEKPVVIDDSEASTVADYVDENSETCEKCEKLKDFFTYIIEPDDIEACEIYSQDDEPKLLYQGTCKEIPDMFRRSDIGKFGTGGALLLINVGEDVEEGNKLSDILSLYDNDEDEVVCITDQESGEEIACGKRDDIIKEYGDRGFISLEAPKMLAVYVKPEGAVEEVATEVTPKDELLHEIFQANNLSDRKINDKRSVEYWINESLIEQDHEDLDSVYASFIRPTHNKSLIESFKSFTGYKDALDIVQEEFSDLLETKAKNDDETSCALDAKKLLKENPDAVSVIYGYIDTKGKFFAIDPIVTESKRESELAAEKTELKYHCKGRLRVAYSSKPMMGEAVEGDDHDKNNRSYMSARKRRNTSEALDNFVDRTMKKIMNAVDGDDLEDIIEDIEVNLKSGTIADDEYDMLMNKVRAKMDSLVESALNLSNKEKLNEEVDSTDAETKALNYIRDKSYADYKNGTVFDPDDYDTFAETLAANGVEPTEELFSTYFEFIDGVQDAEMKESLSEDVSGSLPKSTIADLERALNAGEEVEVGYTEEDAEIGTVDDEAYASTEYVAKIDPDRGVLLDKYITGNNGAGDGRAFFSDDCMKFDSIEDLIKYLKGVKFVNSYYDLNESLTEEIEVDAFEEVKRWGKEDAAKDAVINSFDVFEKRCSDNGLMTEGSDELYDAYLEAAGFVGEALTEAVNEADKLHADDKIEVKVNGEVVHTGLAKDVFVDDNAMNEFHNKSTFANGVYSAQEGSEKWEIRILDKENTDASTTTEVETETTTETNEQLEKETDPDEIAVLQNMRDAAEDEMDYCDDHNDPMGAVRAAKRIDRIDEEEKVCEKCGKPVEECACSREETISYRTRKELGEAIAKCKANNQQYKVSRSINEGYRYDLTILHEEEGWQGDTFEFEGPDDWKADELELQASKRDFEAEEAAMKELNALLASEEVQAAIDAAEVEAGIPDESNAPEEAVCPICGKVGEECTCVDFDADMFDKELNDYFDEAYDEPILYTTEKGSIDQNGNIMLEGLVECEGAQKHIHFTLTPSGNLNEGADASINYKVTNDLSEEVFEFSFNK